MAYTCSVLATFCAVLGCLVVLVSAQPLELDDSFLTNRGSHPWLVEFYSASSKEYRSVAYMYYGAAYDLQSQKVKLKVARCDVNKWSEVAAEFGVEEHPTVLYIHGDDVFTHRGERSRESIMEFARKALGPRVRPVANMGRFNDIRGDHADGVFFMYVGDQDQFGDLASKYAMVADRFAVLSYFYTGLPSVLPPEYKLKHDPGVMVIKDGKQFEFPQSPEGVTKKELEDYVNGERFTIFPKSSGGSLNEMSELDKKIVMVITDDKDKKAKTKQERFKDMARFLITTQREQFHKDFQFTWMGEKETAESITMMTLASPSLIVLDPQTQFYYLPPFPLDEMTRDDLADFLKDVHNDKIEAYGGTGFIQRVKRLFYDIFITIYSLYEQSGWLALLILGVPVLVLSIVCYALCCMEPFDDSVLERGEDEEGDEQKPLIEGEGAGEADDEGDGRQKPEELKKTE